MAASFIPAATALLLMCMQLMGADAAPAITKIVPTGSNANLLAAVKSGKKIYDRRQLVSSNIAPDAICGKDTNVASAVSNVCKMYLEFADGNQYVCSAWVIGPNKVATAGHCVVDNQSDSFITSAFFTCGGNGAAGPFYDWETAVVYTAYLDAPDDVHFTDGAVVSIVGTFPAGIKYQKFGDLDTTLRCKAGKATVTVAGYPAVPDPPCLFDGLQQWSSKGKLKCGNTYQGMYQVNVDSCGGGSGSRLVDAGRKAVGIFTAEATNAGACITNLGTRILDGGTGVNTVDGIALQPLIDYLDNN